LVILDTTGLVTAFNLATVLGTDHLLEPYLMVVDNLTKVHLEVFTILDIKILDIDLLGLLAIVPEF